MASMDYGVIVFENRKLKEDIKQGAGSSFQVGEHTYFERGYFVNEVLNYRIYHGSELEEVKKKVYYWSFEKDDSKSKYFEDIQVKTKSLGNGIYLSHFKMNGNHYDILQGYDVSLNTWWSKSTKRLIYNVMKSLKK